MAPSGNLSTKMNRELLGLGPDVLKQLDEETLMKINEIQN